MCCGDYLGCQPLTQPCCERPKQFRSSDSRTLLRLCALACSTFSPQCERRTMRKTEVEPRRDFWCCQPIRGRCTTRSHSMRSRNPNCLPIGSTPVPKTRSEFPSARHTQQRTAQSHSPAGQAQLNRPTHKCQTPWYRINPTGSFSQFLNGVM